MPSVEWMSVGREFGTDVEVYISDAPSSIISNAKAQRLGGLTLHQYCAKELEYKVKFFFFPAVLDFEGVGFVCLNL